MEWTGQPIESVSYQLTATQLFDTPASYYRESFRLFSATGTYSCERWYFTLASYYRGPRQTLIQNGSQKQQLDSYWLVNLKWGYHWDSSIEIWTEMLNTLDEDYATPTMTDYIEEGVPGRGREARIGFDWNY